MTVTGKELAYAIADNFSAHNLVHHVVKGHENERLRLISGATMAAIGFALGPELSDQIQEMRKGTITDTMKKRFMYTAGGIVLGGVLGYVSGPKIHTFKTQRFKQRDLQDIADHSDVTKQGFDWQNPGPLLTLASAGWLGYGLIKRDQTQEMRQRQLYGLGAGAVGYFGGPHIMEQVKGFTLSEEAYNQGREIYSRGTATLAAIVGGALGWHMVNDNARPPE